MSKLQEIWDGWKNNLTPQSMLDPYIKKISEERVSICRGCDKNSEHPDSVVRSVRFDEHCTECGCTLSAKTKSLTSSCPLGKWEAAVKDK